MSSTIQLGTLLGKTLADDAFLRNRVLRAPTDGRWTIKDQRCYIVLMSHTRSTTDPECRGSRVLIVSVSVVLRLGLIVDAPCILEGGRSCE